MATYKDIQNYIRNSFGINVATCHIADAKRKLGMCVRIAPNRRRIDNLVKPCPGNYLPFIKQALEYFGDIR